MKVGIVILVVGVLLLLVSIPYSIFTLFMGIQNLTQNDLSAGFLGYSGLIGVILGFILTVIGATSVFGRPRSR